MEEQSRNVEGASEDLPDIDQEPHRATGAGQSRSQAEYQRSANDPATPPEDNNETRPSEVVDAPVVETQGCVMMGVVKSGKTTLLTAIKRACDLPAKDDLNLEFIAGKDTAEKIKFQLDRIAGKEPGHGATTDARVFPFEVHVTGKAPNFWTPALEAQLHVVMSDGGGEFLLPSTGDSKDTAERQRLLREARAAQSIVLCVDITNPGSATLEKELPIAFSEMVKPLPFRSPVHWTAKLKNKVRRLPPPQPQARVRNCLNVDRFLILLTQVDKIQTQLPTGAGTTIRFAAMIDPVAQARELLGSTVLRTIRSALKPSATLAIGKISAMGFHPVTGDPFADVNGEPLELDSQTGERVLRRWTPYGIRDAIYFLATRKCRGAVRELTQAELEADAELLDFSYAVNPQPGEPQYE